MRRVQDLRHLHKHYLSHCEFRVCKETEVLSIESIVWILGGEEGGEKSQFVIAFLEADN